MSQQIRLNLVTNHPKNFLLGLICQLVKIYELYFYLKETFFLLVQKSYVVIVVIKNSKSFSSSLLIRGVILFSSPILAA